ncbi:hypothetical protein BKA70DRAFT_1432446 [Coprinopsis sp. MPI-PUGE-AT-0042]|nr:hypothetical protein BKA70DRAFT_1432446 [Coprinopsis sp. MPI-PUGE-AT-0042]
MSRRVRFADEPRCNTVFYADATVDTSDLTAHVTTATEQPSFTLVQGSFPTLDRPLSEHLAMMSLSPPRSRRRLVEPGPPDVPSVAVGPSEADQESSQHSNGNETPANHDSDSDDTLSSDGSRWVDIRDRPPQATPKHLPSVNIPFVLDRSSAAYDENAPWWYVVTIGKVLGVFCDHDFVKRVCAPSHSVVKFSDFDEARRYYDKQKEKQNLRVLRSGNNDEQLYGNLAYATM